METTLDKEKNDLDGIQTHDLRIRSSIALDLPLQLQGREQIVGEKMVIRGNENLEGYNKCSATQHK